MAIEIAVKEPVRAAVKVAVKHMGRTLGWIFARIQSGRGRGDKRRQLHLVESLALGNRRQLMLVDCGSQRYLVGAGADSVGSLLAIAPEVASQEAAGAASRPASRPVAGAALRSNGVVAKGPQLVRRGGRQIAAKPGPGAGLWE